MMGNRCCDVFFSCSRLSLTNGCETAYSFKPSTRWATKTEYSSVFHVSPTCTTIPCIFTYPLSEYWDISMLLDVHIIYYTCFFSHYIRTFSHCIWELELEYIHVIPSHVHVISGKYSPCRLPRSASQLVASLPGRGPCLVWWIFSQETSIIMYIGVHSFDP